jgi:hypothetical protein
MAAIRDTTLGFGLPSEQCGYAEHVLRTVPGPPAVFSPCLTCGLPIAQAHGTGEALLAELDVGRVLLDADPGNAFPEARMECGSRAKGSSTAPPAGATSRMSHCTSASGLIVGWVIPGSRGRSAEAALGS